MGENLIVQWRRHRAEKRRLQQDRVLAVLALAARRGEPEMASWPLRKVTGLRSRHLYAALTELENRGEVMARWGERTPNGGRRRYYRLADVVDTALNELEG